MQSSFTAGSFCQFPQLALRKRYVSQFYNFKSRFSHSAEFHLPNDAEHFYIRNSLKFWNKFYKCHKDKFFKDRHYLEKDWGKYFSDDDTASVEDDKVVLEVGCGAGNTIFPLIRAYPKLFVHACDFSPEAVSLVKSHESFNGDRLNVFVCDIAKDDLCLHIKPSSVDVVTLVFVLSAVSPTKMFLVLQNLKRVLKPNGHVLLRDYAVGDFAQVKLQTRKQIIDENFYFREDGTMWLQGCGFEYLLQTHSESLKKYYHVKALDTCHFQQALDAVLYSTTHDRGLVRTVECDNYRYLWGLRPGIYSTDTLVLHGEW